VQSTRPTSVVGGLAASRSARSGLTRPRSITTAVGGLPGLAGDEDVAGLDVAVDVAPLVDRRAGPRAPAQQLERLIPGEALAPILAQVLLEVRAVEQLHGDVGGAVELAGAEHPHEVRMADLCGGPGLLDHAGAQLVGGHLAA
jgi:hypothetical protein